MQAGGEAEVRAAPGTASLEGTLSPRRLARPQPLRAGPERWRETRGPGLGPGVGPGDAASGLGESKEEGNGGQLS